MFFMCPLITAFRIHKHYLVALEKQLRRVGREPSQDPSFAIYYVGHLSTNYMISLTFSFFSISSMDTMLHPESRSFLAADSETPLPKR